MLNHRYFFYKEPAKPYPLNLNTTKTQNLIPQPEASTPNRKLRSQSPTKQHKTSYDEYNKKIHEVRRTIPTESGFNLNKTFVSTTSDRDTLFSTKSHLPSNTKTATNSPSKVTNWNKIMLLETFSENRRLSMNSKPRPPSLDLKSVILPTKTRFEENSTIYGDFLAMSLLPSRALPNNSKPSTPFYKTVKFNRKTALSSHKNAFITQESNLNKTQLTFKSVQKAAKPRPQSSQRKNHNSVVNNDFDLNRSLDLEEKEFALKDLERNLKKLERENYSVKGDPIHPTLGEKLFKIQAMNDEYLQPLIQTHKKKIFDTRIML